MHSPPWPGPQLTRASLLRQHPLSTGDFHVGQLVQVTRSDGSWTYARLRPKHLEPARKPHAASALLNATRHYARRYGKIMAYDDGGDTYSVMTRAGAKHFVERADLTDDVVVNPSDGSCAQQ